MRQILLAFHWPHDRFALGWEYMRPDEKHEFTTIRLFLCIMTLEIDLD
jgi:hypothetical protein